MCSVSPVCTCLIEEGGGWEGGKMSVWMDGRTMDGETGGCKGGWVDEWKEGRGDL